MKKNYLKQKGFTLVEILIVVVILAILAALILPRLLSQPERAVIAEAQQMLGTLRRAQQTRSDTTGAGNWLAFDCGATTTCEALVATPVLNQLGIKAPSTSTKFSYACAATNDCTATRLTDATWAGATVKLDDAGQFTCGGTPAYTYASSTDHSKGCAI